MRRYRVPAGLCAPLVGGVDRRLRRCLRVSGALHLVFLIVVLITPARKIVFAPPRVVPRERIARVLPPRHVEVARPQTPPAAPKPPPPAPQPPAPKPAPPAPKPAPPAPKPAPPKPQVAPAPPRTPAPRPPAPARGGGAPRPQPGPPPAAAPPAGGQGRAAAAKVAADVQRTTASVDNLLASLQGTIPVRAGSGGSGSGLIPGSGSGNGSGSGTGLGAGLRGGRGVDELGSIDGVLRGTGAGTGTRGRGVAKSGVDIVDDGVLREGDGSGASGRDSRSLMAVVERYKSGVKFCYDTALKTSPHLAGKLTLQMDIPASGSVDNLQVIGDTLGDPEVQRCIRSQVRNWRFPAIQAGTVRFTLPLVFTPSTG